MSRLVYDPGFRKARARLVARTGDASWDRNLASSSSMIVPRLSAEYGRGIPHPVHVSVRAFQEPLHRFHSILTHELYHADTAYQGLNIRGEQVIGPDDLDKVRPDLLEHAEELEALDHQFRSLSSQAMRDEAFLADLQRMRDARLEPLMGATPFGSTEDRLLTAVLGAPTPRRLTQCHH